MSLETGFTWTYGDIKLVGYSLAGISTSVAFPVADVCFDVAQGLPYQIPINNLLITHGHMDHASGLPYMLGQKAMRGLKPPQIYLPAPLEAPMRKIIELWGQIEDHTYAFDMHTVAPDAEVMLKGKFLFRTFPTFHRVPSQGYTIFERKKRLKAEHANLNHNELGALRRKGITIDEQYDDALVSFTGDTKIEFLDSAIARSARVLVMEVTYWDPKKSVETAREWGHTHIDELLPRLDQITSEKILLIHSSARYSLRALNAILDERVPAIHRERVEIFPRP